MACCNAVQEASVLQVEAECYKYVHYIYFEACYTKFNFAQICHCSVCSLHQSLHDVIACAQLAEAMDSLHRQIREKQQRAAVDLKHHIDAAQAELADKAEIHQTRARQQAEMHAKEFDSLLQSGQNPYAVGSLLLS